MAAYELVTVSGLQALLKFKQLPKDIETAAYRSINKALDRARTDAVSRMQNQVNFTASYLSPSGNRLNVASRASAGNLQGKIVGRDRPTSLARFATATKASKQGILVQVKPGSVRYLKRAFFMRLRAGSGTETQSNLGLAIRLPMGVRPRRADKGGAKQIAPGLWLLYGPSVGQVFNTVRQDVVPATLDFMEAEFERLLAFNG